jgi:hypothetical protein
MEQPSGRAESRTAKALFRQERRAQRLSVWLQQPLRRQARNQSGRAHRRCARWLLHEALSLILGEAKLTAERMETTAEVTLEKVADGFAITAVHLTLKGKVAGADQAKFEELAGKAKAGCPVSKLLNAKITLDATLVD